MNWSRFASTGGQRGIVGLDELDDAGAKPDCASFFTRSSTTWMLTGSRSTGRSSANTSMRSTSFTMRSASSQIRRVSVRSSSSADCSSSCAAPRMPESGFLISCASMAASAITERAAPRWVSCRSILSAMVRSCSITTTWPGRSGTGATLRSTRRSPGLRGVDRSTRYSFTAEPRLRTCSTSASSGEPNGTRSRSAMAPQQQHRDFEEGFGRDVRLGDLAVRRRPSGSDAAAR